jgi:agmatinase
MTAIHPDQFLGLPGCALEQADAVLVPLPLEKTASYGTGTWRAPRAILDASCQIEYFDEETLVDFAEAPEIHTLAPLTLEGTLEQYLSAAQDHVRRLRGNFVLALGGEHTVTHAVVTGLVEDVSQLTIVQIDAHADLADELEGLKWSHGTVMRRLWEEGCRLVQIGVRSLSRGEYELAAGDERITTYYAHRLTHRWQEVIRQLGQLQGPVYLSIDVDGFDPAVFPNTGTPQPDGLSWSQVMEVIRAVTSAPQARLLGSDVVEYIASPHPPGADPLVAKLVAKVLAFWYTNRQEHDS